MRILFVTSNRVGDAVLSTGRRAAVVAPALLRREVAA
jgi:hypothetical protein